MPTKSPFEWASVFRDDGDLIRLSHSQALEVADYLDRLAVIVGRRFPVLPANGTESSHAHPTSVPWEWVKTFESQIVRNHRQTLEELAPRGGLSPAELLLAYEGLRPFGIDGRKITEEDGAQWLKTCSFDL